MRTSSSVALLFAASALAAPVAREQLDARQGRLGNAANIAGLANAGLFGINFLSDLFGGGDEAAAKRDLVEVQDLLARQGRLGNAANIAGLANAGLFGINFLSDLFGGGDEAAAKRDLDEVQDLLARQGRLGNAANIAGIANAGLFGLNFLSDLFGGGEEAAAKRELIQGEINDLVARQGRLGNAASAATIGVAGLSLLQGLGSLLGLGGEEAAPAARELIAELQARDLEIRQGRLGNAANIAGLGLGLTGILSQLGSLFGGGEEAAPATRELIAAIHARDLEIRQGRLGNAANIAGLGLGLTGILSQLGSLFGGDAAAKRELDELVARQGRLANAANIAGLGLGINGIINGLGDLFGRDAAEELAYMARRDLSSIADLD